MSSPYVDEITYGTFYVINGLQPCTAYMVGVSSVYDDDETYLATISGKTNSGGEFLLCCGGLCLLLVFSSTFPNQIRHAMSMFTGT